MANQRLTFIAEAVQSQIACFREASLQIEALADLYAPIKNLAADVRKQAVANLARLFAGKPSAFGITDGSANRPQIQKPVSKEQLDNWIDEFLTEHGVVRTYS